MANNNKVDKQLAAKLKALKIKAQKQQLTIKKACDETKNVDGVKGQ